MKWYELSYNKSYHHFNQQQRLRNEINNFDNIIVKKELSFYEEEIIIDNNSDGQEL